MMNCSKCGEVSHANDCSPKKLDIHLDLRTQLLQHPILGVGPPTENSNTTMDYVVKDSGKRQDFSSGAVRDTQDGKGDYSALPLGWVHDLVKQMQIRNQPSDRVDLLPVEELLRLASVYGKGSQKYGDFNWQRGMPMSRYASSIQRHLKDFALGDASEDHLMQAAWNCFAMAWTETAVRAGRLPRELGDYGTMIEPTHVLSQTTELREEDGSRQFAMPTVFLLSHVCLLKELGEYSLIVHRRKGAVVKGWVHSTCLTPLEAATAATAETTPALPPTSLTP